MPLRPGLGEIPGTDGLIAGSARNSKRLALQAQRMRLFEFSLRLRHEPKLHEKGGDAHESADLEGQRSRHE
jgi:hypothetical protein